MRDDVVAGFLEADQLAIALDADAPLCEPRDEEALVLVLRVDEPERIRALACAKSPQLDAGPPLASGPEIRRREDEPRVDDLAGEAELAVELQRARLHRKGTRGRARLGRLVDDADSYARPGEPESEYEPRRTSADDEDFAVHGSNSTVDPPRQCHSSAPSGPAAFDHSSPVRIAMTKAQLLRGGWPLRRRAVRQYILPLGPLVCESIGPWQKRRLKRVRI